MYQIQTDINHVIHQLNDKHEYFFRTTNLLGSETQEFYKIAIFLLKKKMELGFQSGVEQITLKDIFKKTRISLLDKEELKLTFLGLLKANSTASLAEVLRTVIAKMDELSNMEIKKNLLSVINFYAPDIDWDYLEANYQEFLSYPIDESHTKILDAQIKRNSIPDITLSEFIEKYPEFEQLMDKDGLTMLCFDEFKKHGYYCLDGIYYKDYFIHFDSSFRELLLRFSFLAEFLHFAAVSYRNNNNISFRVRLDFSKIISLKKYRSVTLIGGAYFGPKFKPDLFFETKKDVLFTRKIRENHKFNDFFGNKISFTDFFIDQANNSFQIEEIGFNNYEGSFVNRLIHSEFDTKTRTIRHFDGSILLYDSEGIKSREATLLSKYPRLSHSKYKLFRMDGEIKLDDFIFLTLSYFDRNELVLEYFDFESYNMEYSSFIS